MKVWSIGKISINTRQWKPGSLGSCNPAAANNNRRTVERIVKLEERVIALEGGLASASHVTSVLQEQLTAKTDELEMYSRKSCIVLTGLCKEKNENLNKLKEDVVETLWETGISKEEITNNIGKLHRIGKTDKNNT